MYVSWDSIIFDRFNRIEGEEKNACILLIAIDLYFIFFNYLLQQIRIFSKMAGNAETDPRTDLFVNVSNVQYAGSSLSLTITFKSI